MKKMYRGYVKIIQNLRYFYGKFKKRSDREYINLLLTLENNGERLTTQFSRDMSKGIRVNKCFPAGKVIEFEIEEKTITIEIFYRFRQVLDNMDNLGTSGVDVYVKNEEKFVWMTSIYPENNYQMYVKRRLEFKQGISRVRLYLPSFAALTGIYIKKNRIKYISPNVSPNIVVYGSSISQGCAASRPGMSYINQISRKLRCNIENLGFSESAKGEQKIIEYISQIPTQVLILEYDHNASIDELRNTHLKAYCTIRENFSGWIIMMTRFSGGLSITLTEEKERIDIIHNTFEYAISTGDKKIVFFDGSTLFSHEKEKYFVDKVHPNDAGMNKIADMLCSLIDKKRMLE